METHDPKSTTTAISNTDPYEHTLGNFTMVTESAPIFCNSLWTRMVKIGLLESAPNGYNLSVISWVKFNFNLNERKQM